MLSQPMAQLVLIFLLLQEELKFCQFPELLALLLVCDEMETNEALLVKGVAQFCHCIGCGSSLEFVEEYVDQSKVKIESALYYKSMHQFSY